MKKATLWLTIALIVCATLSVRAGTVVYDPDAMGLNSGSDVSGSYAYFLPGVSMKIYWDGSPAVSPSEFIADPYVRVNSSSGDKFFATNTSDGFPYNSDAAYNNVFRTTFDSETDMVSLNVWGSGFDERSWESCSATLNAYNASGSLVGSVQTSASLFDSSPKETLKITASGIKYIELVPTSGSSDVGPRVDSLSFFGNAIFRQTQTFQGYSDTSANGTTASLIGGTAGGSRTIDTSFTLAGEVDAGIATLAGDVLSFTGTGSDMYVLSMQYTDQAVADAGLTEEDLRMLWVDGNGDFVNAVLGNSNAGTTGEDLFVAGAYNSATHTLGTYGVDTANNTVWAVLDHNSDFAPGVVPEPATIMLVLAGIAGLKVTRKFYAQK